jgi:hypothetical protein
LLKDSRAGSGVTLLTAGKAVVMTELTVVATGLMSFVADLFDQELERIEKDIHKDLRRLLKRVHS